MEKEKICQHFLKLQKMKQQPLSNVIIDRVNCIAQQICFFTAVLENQTNFSQPFSANLNEFLYKYSLQVCWYI